jgi:hypothetical protein
MYSELFCSNSFAFTYTHIFMLIVPLISNPINIFIMEEKRIVNVVLLSVATKGQKRMLGWQCNCVSIFEIGTEPVKLEI